MTTRDFKLPDLGEGLEDAEIVRWLVAVGDDVRIDQPVVEVVTAKASVELPSPYEGRVTALHYGVGDVVEVGRPLLSIADDSGGPPQAETRRDTTDGAASLVPAVAADLGADQEAEPEDSESSSGNVLVGYGTRPARRRRRAASARRLPPAEAEPAAKTDLEPASAAPTTDEPASAAVATDEPESAAVVTDEPGAPPVLSPVVRRLARDRGVDLGGLRGSGPNGVITRADVEAAEVEEADVKTTDADGTDADGTDAEAGGTGGAAGATRTPIRGLHRQMAELVTRSRREIPEATVWVDVDATGLVEARRSLATSTTEPVTIVSLIARFCVLGLQRWPALNSRIEGDEIVGSGVVNVGFAAQTERGLLVPVVHDAGDMTLAELDADVRRLAAAARSGKLKAEDLTGGTFTVNNYGVFGVDGSAAIINHPQVAMVGIGRIIERPWVVDGEVTARPVTELTLAFDHRVCDGGVAGGFLRFVADCVEQPLRAL